MVSGARASPALVVALTLCLKAQGAPSFVTLPQRDKALFIGAPSADVSANGRCVAFESFARLVPADTDNRRDIYVLDRATGQVTLETGTLERWSNGAHPRLSADGRWLVFEAEASASERPAVRVDIVVIDRSTGRVISVRSRDGGPPNGSSYAPEISDDGRVIVFSSAATDLVSLADVNGGLEDIYTMEMASGAVRRISVDATGVQLSTGFSFSPSLSADGSAVAFVSTALLNPTAARHADRRSTQNLRQVYVRDETQQTTTQISVGVDGEWPDGPSMRPAISGDGRFVAFVSEAAGLVRDDRNRVADIFVYDRRAGTTTIVTRAHDGTQANGRSSSPAISVDGRAVAFQSDASNLICGRRCAGTTEDVNLLWDVFVWDRERKTIARVSDDLLGMWGEPSVAPAIDAQGVVVAFASRHPIDEADGANDFDLFVRELPDAQATLVQQREPR